jgi:hypothetical protein
MRTTSTTFFDTRTQLEKVKALCAPNPLKIFLVRFFFEQVLFVLQRKIIIHI